MKCWYCEKAKMEVKISHGDTILQCPECGATHTDLITPIADIPLAHPRSYYQGTEK